MQGGPSEARVLLTGGERLRDFERDACTTLLQESSISENEIMITPSHSKPLRKSNINEKFIKQI
jgi:hypothetical protein